MIWCGYSQETFIEVRVNCDEGYFLELDGGRESRQKALDELITTLMKALAPDRGRKEKTSGDCCCVWMSMIGSVDVLY